VISLGPARPTSRIQTASTGLVPRGPVAANRISNFPTPTRVFALLRLIGEGGRAWSGAA
jgi:hypothetical protein